MRRDLRDHARVRDRLADPAELRAHRSGSGYDAVGFLISSFSFDAARSSDPVRRPLHRPPRRAGDGRRSAPSWVGVSSVLAGLAPTFPLLVVFRSRGRRRLGAVLRGAALVPAADDPVAIGSGRVMSVYYASFNVGFIAGGPLGGLIAKWFGAREPRCYVYGGDVLRRRRGASGGRSATPSATARGDPPRRLPPAAVGPAVRHRPRRRTARTCGSWARSTRP